MMTRILITACLAFAALHNTSASAGEWLGGQYWGQISGCGHCGGSLYGLGGYCCEGSCQSCSDCFLPAAPLSPAGLAPTEAIPPGIDALPDPAVPNLDVPVPPVRRTSVLLKLTSSRRAHMEAVPANEPGDILPIAPSQSAGAVKTITHLSQPERLAPPAARIVAPNAWSGRLYR